MSRMLMLIVLMLSASSAWAEWTLFSESPEKGGYKDYLDFSTIRRTGNLVEVWVLGDYWTVQTVGGRRFLSLKMQMQIDCREEKSRILAASSFTGHMGEGDFLGSQSDPYAKWKLVEPGSNGAELFKIVCDKK